MPLYDFKCKCTEEFTIYSSIVEYEDHPKCPKCKSRKTHQVLQPISVVTSKNQTLGGLADRNSAKLGEQGMADLYKQHNQYKEDAKASRPELPEGMEYLDK